MPHSPSERRNEPIALSRAGSPLLLTEWGRGERLIAALVPIDGGYAAAELGWSGPGRSSRPWTILEGKLAVARRGWRIGDHHIRKVDPDCPTWGAALHAYRRWRAAQGELESWEAAARAIREEIANGELTVVDGEPERPSPAPKPGRFGLRLSAHVT